METVNFSKLFKVKSLFLLRKEGQHLPTHPTTITIPLSDSFMYYKSKNETITRNQSKTINLGLQYSMGKLLLASQLKLPVDKASDLVA